MFDLADGGSADASRSSGPLQEFLLILGGRGFSFGRKCRGLLDQEPHTASVSSSFHWHFVNYRLQREDTVRLLSVTGGLGNFKGPVFKYFKVLFNAKFTLFSINN